jgi:hypothetical protein
MRGCLFGACLALGCVASAEAEQAALVSSAGEPARVQAPRSKPPSPADRCRERRAELERLPALEGAPGLERARSELLARAKGEPVVFVRTPRPDETDPEARRYRALLEKSPSPGWALYGLYRHLRGRHELARRVLLREGYLYTESPELAGALAMIVELHHLFRDPEVWIHRGSRVLRVVRGKHGWYEYADGAERGRRARVLLFDRVGRMTDDLGAPLHRDLRALMHARGFDRIEIERVTERGMLARLRYGDVWVPGVVASQGARTSLECEAPPEARAGEAASARDHQLRRDLVFSAARAAIVEQVAETLPFDEPRTEEGQQDGNLRPAWKWAYEHGWDSYTFNEDPYPVFDALGRPRVPQVCIDFVTDTLERASGSWWQPRGQPRARTPGRLDFGTLGISNRRSVEVFLDFAEQHPEWFDVYRLDPAERVPLIRRRDFYDHLGQHRDRYRPGDIVAIHGLRGDGEMHWHSFWVYESDPVTGAPILVASNAGKPRVRSWDQELLSAPRRSIHTRIRPRLEWLESFVTPPAADPDRDPAPLVASPI